MYDIDAAGGGAAVAVDHTGCYEGGGGAVLGVAGVHCSLRGQVLACFVLHGGPCTNHRINKA